MARKLYMIYGSPPVNSVLMTASALSLELELHHMNFQKNQHLEDWFLKINPSHTVPTLDDNGFILWDSHSILIYLVETYGKNGYLYSTVIKDKSRIHQVLNLDCGTLFRRFSDCVKPIFYEGQKTIDPKKLDDLKESYKFLERLLQSNKFLAGDQLTIADISVLSTVAPSDIVLPINEEEFPKLTTWLSLLKTMDFFEAGIKGLDAFRDGYKIMTAAGQ